ncbi:MAG: SCP2 sterol-binding domain-containing protein [Rhodocyclaceae bacterium]
MIGDTWMIGALNRLIEREAWAREALRAHSHESAVLRVAGMSLRFRITDTGLVEPDHDEGEPNVSIEVPASALSHAFDGPDALSRHARIAGDARLAETIARLLKYLRPDAGAWLAPLTGDIVAHRLQGAVAGAARTVQTAARNASANVYEYMSEEAGWVVKRVELEANQDELARLRDDLARLEKRVERLAPSSLAGAG